MLPHTARPPVTLHSPWLAGQGDSSSCSSTFACWREHGRKLPKVPTSLSLRRGSHMSVGNSKPFETTPATDASICAVLALDVCCAMSQIRVDVIELNKMALNCFLPLAGWRRHGPPCYQRSSSECIPGNEDDILWKDIGEWHNQEWWQRLHMSHDK